MHIRLSNSIKVREMFSANSFSEASFSELDTPIVASGITGGDVVIHF